VRAISKKSQQNQQERSYDDSRARGVTPTRELINLTWSVSSGAARRSVRALSLRAHSWIVTHACGCWSVEKLSCARKQFRL